MTFVLFRGEFDVRPFVATFASDFRLAPWRAWSDHA